MSDTIDRNLLPPTVDEYISELLIVKARSKATVNQYITDLYLFFCYLEKYDTTLSPGQDRKIYDLLTSESLYPLVSVCLQPD